MTRLVGAVTATLGLLLLSLSPSSTHAFPFQPPTRTQLEPQPQPIRRGHQLLPRQRPGLERCVPGTFASVIEQFGGRLAAGSPYNSQTEPSPTPVLFYAAQAPVSIPDICGVRINITANDSTNNVAFELYLPSPQRWNRRFLAVGNGAFDGGTSRADMFGRAVHGWAVMSTNTGHEERLQMWAARGRDVQVDWAWRAMAQSVPFAKAVVQAYYGDVSTVASYYSGCSTGGRQGIRQVEVDPASFDGILIGSPAWNVRSAMPVLSRVGWLAQTYGLLVGAVNDPLLERIAARVTRECNVIGRDNAPADGVVSDSRACLEHFVQSGPTGPVWEGLDCGTDNPNCVTISQREAFLAIVRGEFKLPPENVTYAGDGFDITSLRDMATFLLQSTAEGFDQDFSRYFLGQLLVWNNDANGAELIRRSYAWDADVRANADPSILAGWDGKVILYSGTADGFVSDNGTRRAFELAGGSSNPNLRYFELPGMPHCIDSGNGGDQPPWYIGGVGLPLKPPYNRWYMPNGTNPPLNNPQHDALHALTAWVEGQRNNPPAPAPTQFLSTAFSEWPGPTLPNISKRRPICAYPLRQRWNGVGNVNMPGSWSCVSDP